MDIPLTKVIDACEPQNDPCNCNEPTIIITPNTPTCQSTNGSLSTTITGGTEPYIYAWSTGASTESISNLAADFYEVTVTDANGCESIAGYHLQGESGLDLRPRVRDADCGSDNANIRLRPQGSPGPYTYVWSNGSTAKNQFGLSAGTYSVTVTDGNRLVLL